MRYRHIATLTFMVAVGVCASPAQAQLVITDPANTAKNAATASLKNLILEILGLERDRLHQMAKRLTARTSFGRYAVDDVPRWRIHAFNADTYPHAHPYTAALNYGDSRGAGYFAVARSRRVPDAVVLAHLGANARDVVTRSLATLDLADSTIIAGTHQTGALRFNGRRELAAIDALQRHVMDPSDEQSATAILDKVSGAVLIATRQKQARLQFLAAIAEQLLVENKRARDTEAASMNMQLGRLRQAEPALLAGSGDDFRHWRQP